MAHAGLQHCLPCPSKATALLYCNCHLALPCPHCTATPVSLRLTALPGMHTPAAPRMHCVLRVPHFFALPVPAVPYGFVRNRPFTVRMSCMLCAASACRRSRSMRGQCASAQIVRLRKLQSPSLHGRTLHPAPPRDTGTAYPLHGPRMMNLQSTAAARRGKQECQSPCTPLHACSHHALVHARPCIAPSRRDKGNCLAPAWHCLLALLRMIA